MMPLRTLVLAPAPHSSQDPRSAWLPLGCLCHSRTQGMAAQMCNAPSRAARSLLVSKGRHPSEPGEKREKEEMDSAKFQLRRHFESRTLPVMQIASILCSGAWPTQNVGSQPFGRSLKSITSSCPSADTKAKKECQNGKREKAARPFSASQTHSRPTSPNPRSDAAADADGVG